jgi:hypothetical protein
VDYFGIKTPQRDNEAPYIWWIANSRHEAWMSFFQYPSAKREMNPHKPAHADTRCCHTLHFTPHPLNRPQPTKAEHTEQQRH